MQLLAVPEVITPDVNTLIRISAVERIILLLKKFFILGGETFVVQGRSACVCTDWKACATI